MEPKVRLPEEERLDVFAGQWQNTGGLMPNDIGHSGDMIGNTAYEWAMGGKWLQYSSQLDLPGMGKYEVQGGVVYNQQSKKYDSYAVNSLGLLMVYEGDWVDDSTLEFLLTYPLPAGRARITYTIQSNGSIRMTSENLRQSGVFETYFETDMNRVK